MLEALFSSRVRGKLLAVLFLSPGTKHNAWELSRSLHENYSAVWKELSRLEASGILISEPRGNSKTYQVNPGCPIAPELRSIFLKTAGFATVIRDKLRELGSIKTAFVYGSFASGEADPRSDVDLMIIGEVDLIRLANLIAELEKELSRPINYVIYAEKEWNEKRAQQEPFALNVDRSPKIMLIGGENAL